MAHSITRKKPIGKLIAFGIFSIVLFTALFSNQDMVSGVYTRGGWYAFLPIITALLFSFVHGSFTGHFWTVLGVEAARKKKEVK
jgi:uncharacterized integral membrane protein